MIEATVFEDSDLRLLFTMVPQVSAFRKNVVGYTFFVKPSEDSARAQVFVDRLCEEVWKVERNKWLDGNMSRAQVEFNQSVKPSDLRRFLLA